MDTMERWGQARPSGQAASAEHRGLRRILTHPALLAFCRPRRAYYRYQIPDLASARPLHGCMAVLYG